MILNASSDPLLFSALRVWDHLDQLVSNLVWLNTDSMVASGYTADQQSIELLSGLPQRVRVGRFCFLVAAVDAERLRRLLPEALCDKIEIIE